MKKSVGNLYIKKRSVSEWLIAFVLFLPFVRATFLELLGIPDIISFLADVALVLLMAKVILKGKQIQISKAFSPYLVLIGIFFCYVTITYLFHFQSVFYYVWGLRNYFRFYMAFVFYVIYLKWDDVEQWFKFLDWLYVINFFTIIVQFLMGYRQDFLGGIFGVQKGCNGMVLVFLSVIVTKSVLSFMRNEESTLKCLTFSGIGLLIAAFAELKFFFIVFIVVAVVAAVMTKNSFRKTLFFICVSLLIIIFSSVLAVLYDNFSQFLSFENLWNAIVNSNYSTKEDIGRFTAIPIISSRFLPGWTDRLFGIGLGNADYSSVGIFNTAFFNQFRDSHYMLFTYSFLYLETGIIGLLLYAAFFLISGVVSFRLYKSKSADPFVCQLTIIFSVICFALLVYNAELRTEIAYISYFVLALPLINANKNSHSVYARSGE